MNTSVDISVIERTGRLLEQLLDRAPALGKEHHWEGSFAGIHGTMANSSFGILAQIAFHGELIEGSGGLTAGGEDSRLLADISLAGTLDGDAVELQMWLDVEDTNGMPFVLSGRLDAEQRTIDGEFRVPCFNPDTCGCKGGSGTFRLTKVSG